MFSQVHENEYKIYHLVYGSLLETVSFPILRSSSYSGRLLIFVFKA